MSKHKPTDDTLISTQMLLEAQKAVNRKMRVDHNHDVPYLGGSSRDGKTVYIDRHLPRTFSVDGRRIEVTPFLTLHEAVEKALLDRLKLEYQHAHQLAQRLEQEAVRIAGVSWRAYNRFMEQYIKEAGDERLERLPLDLEIRPYRDERDYQMLQRMQQQVRREHARATGKRSGTGRRKATGRRRRR